MKNPKIIVGLVLVLLVVIVFFQNREEVQTRVLWMTITTSRAASLGTTFVAGVLVGALLLGLKRHHR